MGRTTNVIAAKNQVSPTDVDVITDPYDVVAIIEAEDIVDIGDIVTQEIHTIDGVVSTVTSIAVGPI